MTKFLDRPAVAGVGLAALLFAAAAEAKKCPADSVMVGRACVDRYEASAWEISPSATSLVKRVRKARIATAAEMAGATQRGVVGNDYGSGCPETGSGCKTLYAVSIPGVTPSAYINWFQAAAACRNSGKRLATNQEWQMAALGTPDPGTDNGTTDCNTTSTLVQLPEDPVNTGSRSLCVSDVGANDMVGNVWEWVGDWGGLTPADAGEPGCHFWDATHGGDLTCVEGGTTEAFPEGLIRGGGVGGGTDAGVFAALAQDVDKFGYDVGFRCAREL